MDWWVIVLLTPFDYPDHPDFQPHRCPAFQFQPQPPSTRGTLSRPSQPSGRSSLRTRTSPTLSLMRWGRLGLLQPPGPLQSLLHGACRVTYTVVPGVVTKAVSHMKVISCSWHHGSSEHVFSTLVSTQDCSNRAYRHVDNFRGYRWETGLLRGTIVRAISNHEDLMKLGKFALSPSERRTLIITRKFYLSLTKY